MQTFTFDLPEYQNVHVQMPQVGKILQIRSDFPEHAGTDRIFHERVIGIFHKRRFFQGIGRQRGHHFFGIDPVGHPFDVEPDAGEPLDFLDRPVVRRVRKMQRRHDRDDRPGVLPDRTGAACRTGRHPRQTQNDKDGQQPSRE